MEEPSEEWKVEEGCGGDSKMSLILSRGWRVGKKIMIAGMAISSAPIVLPPLVILSAIGFAFAVPFSLVFAGYACTDKLMSKLLSRPISPSISEAKMHFLDNTESIEEVEEDKNGGRALARQEEELMEDKRRNMEVRIEGIEDERGEKEQDAERVIDEEDYVVEEEEKPVEDMKEVIEEQSKDNKSAYNLVEKEKTIEEVFNNNEDEDVKLIKDINGVLERCDEENVDKIIEEEKPKEEIVNNINDENVEPTKDMTGEESRDEKNVDKPIEEKPIGEKVRHIEEERRVIREKEGVIEQSRDDENIDKTIDKEVKLREETTQITEDNGDEEIVDNTVEEKKPVGDTVDHIEEEAELIRELKGEREQSRDEENVDKPVEEEKPIGEKVHHIEEERRVIRERKGVIEQSRDEENIDKTIDEEVKLGEETTQITEDKGDEEFVVNTVEEKIPVGDTVDHIEEEAELIRELKGEREQSRDEENVDKTIEDERKREEDTAQATKYREDELSTGMVYQEEKPIEEKMRTVEERDDEMKAKEEERLVEEKRDEEKNDIIVEEEKPEAETEGMIGERKDEGIADIMVEDENKPLLETMEVTVLLDMRNIREIADESGLEPFDEENAAVEHDTFTMDEAHEDKVTPTETSFNSSPGVELLDHRADCKPQHVRSEHESTIEEHASVGKESAAVVVSPEMEESIPPKEVLYCEEKIWAQIDAMRKIVGYKAAPQATCMEELKALYVFTGLEPPTPFKDPSDLMEVNDNLRLLMSMVGVK